MSMPQRARPRVPPGRLPHRVAADAWSGPWRWSRRREFLPAASYDARWPDEAPAGLAPEPPLWLMASTGSTLLAAAGRQPLAPARTYLAGAAV